MNWIQLNSAQQIETLKKESDENPVLIFKHSTRCSTSRMSLDRLERNWDEHDASEIKPYFLDLISYRSISNLVADIFGVEHESPQVLVIFKGEAVLDQSHFEIDYQKIKGIVRN
jgi:bacillithiol system protein YtxJ